MRLLRSFGELCEQRIFERHVNLKISLAVTPNYILHPHYVLQELLRSLPMFLSIFFSALWLVSEVSGYLKKFFLSYLC